MEMTLEKFRVESARRRGRRGAEPYSAEHRAFAVAYARTATAQGKRLTASAAALGVSDPTLREWVAKAVPQTRSALRAVVVKPTPAPTAYEGLTLVSPSGFQVRGLDLATTAALLRALT